MKAIKDLALWALAVAVVLLALAVTWAAPRYQIVNNTVATVVRLDSRTGELELFRWEGSSGQGHFERVKSWKVIRGGKR